MRRTSRSDSWLCLAFVWISRSVVPHEILDQPPAVVWCAVPVTVDLSRMAFVPPVGPRSPKCRIGDVIIHSVNDRRTDRSRCPPARLLASRVPCLTSSVPAFRLALSDSRPHIAAGGVSEPRQRFPPAGSQRPKDPAAERERQNIRHGTRDGEPSDARLLPIGASGRRRRLLSRRQVPAGFRRCRRRTACLQT